MATLSIIEFSCLEDAVFTISPVNIIIGPQGSGKSVTTKLFYFFSDIQTSFLQAAERRETLDDYKKHLSRQFTILFPPTAWGPGRFNINYTCGALTVRALRRKKAGKMSEDVNFTFSEWFVGFYKDAVETFERSGADDDIDGGVTLRVNDALDKTWRVKEIMYRRFASELRGDYIAGQTFIPAGRAFFTSIGRLVAGFEQAGSLDPVTIKFARLFASVRDRNSRRVSRINRLGPEFMAKRTDFMNRLFGGEVRFEEEAEFVETTDGRKVPFTSLSSGQQELIPMWTLMDYFAERDAMTITPSGRSTRRYMELVYIEEPEAHLFPSAQSFLMEFLISSIVSDRNKRNLIITTHSPYIMAKLNVFLKAGQLARRKKRNNDINEVVPRECWLTDRQLSAFAIEDRRIKTLIDEDGLIDGRYLDQVSEENSREFSLLLKIESEM